MNNYSFYINANYSQVIPTDWYRQEACVIMEIPDVRRLEIKLWEQTRQLAPARALTKHKHLLVFHGKPFT